MNGFFKAGYREQKIKPSCTKKTKLYTILVCLSAIGLTLETPEKKMVKFANSINPDEVAHNDQPHLDLN